MDTPLLVAVGLGVGLLCGLFNGILVTRFNLSSIVITIGTMSLYRGITYILLGDKALNHYPDSFAWFGQGYVWGALFEFALFILLAAAFTFLLHKTNFGRRTYAIGNNPTGAWFSGINVKRHNLVLFALVGLMAGLAAVLLTSRLGSTRPTLAMGWELAVVTMAVLGGVNILGGSGSMVGVIIAAFLMGLVTFGLSLLNVPGIVMSIIIGAMLIVVISLPIITRRMMQRRQFNFPHPQSRRRARTCPGYPVAGKAPAATRGWVFPKSILRRIIMSFMLALPKISLHGAAQSAIWSSWWRVNAGASADHRRPAGEAGAARQPVRRMDEQQMSYHLFDEVFPNPTEALVQKGYAAYCEAGCDYLIAFGGGSPIDTAKAVKILTANPGPSTAYSGVGKVTNPGVPLVAINTTAGTRRR
jgi:ribose/xylose/arabinose/galactoside ABC-type transport system permease subunit